MKALIRTLHLWASLVFGTLFVVLGLTGSALSWIHELDSLLNPGLMQVAAPAGLHAGAPLRLAPTAVQAAAERLTKDPLYGRPGMIELPERAGDVFVAWYKPAPVAGGSLWQQSVTRQVMLDPATLSVVGERNWGEAGLSRPLLMPTLFHIHRYLVAGEGGKTVVSVAGVALVLVALTGIVLWWPRLSASALWKSVTVRHGGSWPRFSFQLHRAAGFFAAPVLLLAGFSGVSFNMPGWVTPAVNAVAAVTPAPKVSNLSVPGGERLTPAQAVTAAQAQFPEGRVSRLTFPANAKQPYEVRVRQPDELRQGPGATRVTIDSGDGKVLRVIDPLRARRGDKFISWLFPLHTGEAFGTAGRVFVSIFGLLPLMFFVTGLVVWLRLRRKPSKPVRGAVAGGQVAGVTSGKRTRTYQ